MTGAANTTMIVRAALLGAGLIAIPHSEVLAQQQQQQQAQQSFPPRIPLSNFIELLVMLEAEPGDIQITNAFLLGTIDLGGEEGEEWWPGYFYPPEETIGQDVFRLSIANPCPTPYLFEQVAGITHYRWCVAITAQFDAKRDKYYFTNGHYIPASSKEFKCGNSAIPDQVYAIVCE